MRLLEGVARPGTLGRIRRVVGLLVEAVGLPEARLGDLCDIEIRRGSNVRAEVVGIEGESLILMPFDEVSGLRAGAAVEWVREGPEVPVGPELLGRVIDAMGEPIDGKGPLRLSGTAPLHRTPPNPMKRTRVQNQLETGIRSIDGFLGIGEGQRIGAFAGSGVGKSVLLGMVARGSSADINVIALIGERGREVREFIERDLGPEGLARSVVVVATGNESALKRSRAALAATAISEAFRDQGKSVLLMMDSVTRVAMAWREIGLAVGEPATSKGYPSSTFSRLAQLLERSGAGERGMITGIYSVLVDGDDFDEPIADATRGILDGHIMLTRKLAEAAHFPAVDILASTSRVRNSIMDPETVALGDRLMKSEAAWRDKEDLIAVGAYEPGMDPEVDRMLRIRSQMLQVLQQKPHERTKLEETRKLLAFLNKMADAG